MNTISKVALTTAVVPILIAVAASYFHLADTTQPRPPAPTIDREFVEFQAVQRAKRAVQATIREPESARFGRVSRVSTGVVCGYVSARNGFGGMTGMKAFMAGPQVGGLMMEEQGRRAFFKVWNVQCAGQSRKDSAKGRPD